MENAYAKSGVDVKAGYEVVARIQKHVARTHQKGVMGTLGGFGGCFDLSQFALKEPVLVSGTDGVGTKLMVAIQADKHDTIGIDCVAMCVNDIVAQGAKPLYFLDYIATGKNNPSRLESVVSGVAQGCVEAGAALIGGETAEMPGMYGADDYDLAGFAVGVAEKAELITGENVREGDLLIGLPSSGLHSNGFSLVRKIIFEKQAWEMETKVPELKNKKIREVLLTPTKIYVEAILPLASQKRLNGVAHITGGGFVENIPRSLPADCAAEIQLGSWPILPIFSVLEKYGAIPTSEMYEIFNMGIGMVLVVAPEQVEQVETQLSAQGERSYRIGKVIKRQTEAVVFTEVSA